METHLHGSNNTNTNTPIFAENKNANNKDQEASPSASTASSPSHEFSFTISLSSSSTTTSSSSSSSLNLNPNLRNNNNKTTSSQQSPYAIDLSPADDIFFHGHLLPLHFLSHLPVSPRTSINSFDAVTLPVKNLSPQQQPTTNINNNIVINKTNTGTNNHHSIITNSRTMNNNKTDKAGVNGEDREKTTKPNKSFSLFSLPKWRKGFDQNKEKEEEDEEEKQKKRTSLDLSHAFKKYIRMLFQKRDQNSTRMKKRQAYSFSTTASIMGSRRNNYNYSNTNNGYKRDLRGRRGEFSAPASMRTSPTNSGHLLVSASGLSSCSTSDSTMEELQAAIQAAIAHCKNSNNISVDHDKVKNF